MSVKEKPESKRKEIQINPLFCPIVEDTDDGFQLMELIYEKGHVIDFKFLYVNSAFEHQTGLKASFVVGKTIRQFDPAIEDYWFFNFGLVDKTGKASHLLQFNKGTKRWYDVYTFSYSKGIVGSLFRNITEKIETEALLRQREQEFHTLIQASADLVYRMNPDWSEMQKLHGKDFVPDTEENSSNWIEKYILKEDQPKVKALIKHAIDTKTDFALEYRVIKPDGSVGWIHSYAIPILDKHGLIVKWLGTAKDITERKKSEDALRDSETRFKLAQQVAHVGTFEWNIQTGVNKWTPELEAIYGLAPGSFPGTQTAWEQLVYYEDKDLAVRCVSEAIEKGFFEGEWRVVWPDDSIHWIFGRGWVFKDSTGKPLRLIGINIDITERKKTEAALRLSEEQARQRSEELQKLMDIIPAAVWVSNDPQCKVIIGNQTANEFYEAKGDENVSAGPASGEKHDTTRRFFWKGTELLPSQLPMQKAAAENREIKNVEVEVLTPSGKKMTILGSAKPLLTEAGKVRGCLAAFVDITEHKKAVEALAVSEARYRNLYGNLREAFVAVNLDGKIIESNQAYQELLGYTKEELENLTYIDLTPQKWRAMEDRIVREQILPCGYSALYEKEYRRKDGKIVPVELLTYALIDQNGKTTGMAAIVRDITERKNAEKALIANEQAAVKYANELKALHDKLEVKTLEAENYANEMEALAEERARQLRDSERLSAIGATAGMVGHDIRNPLQAILGDIFIVNNNLADLPEGPQKMEIRESMDCIATNVSYINKIVADLQDYARQLIPEYSIFDLPSLINKTLATIAIPSNIHLTVNAKAMRAIKCDQTYLQRSITNLINNAVQAMPSGGDLGVDCYGKDDKVYIVVSDTGTGIPEEVKPKLFTPMTTTKAKGQGLGLAVVKRLIEGLGGKVSFESQEGKGTKFTIELPITPHPKSTEL